jgi:hypothetical protein
MGYLSLDNAVSKCIHTRLQRHFSRQINDLRMWCRATVTGTINALEERLPMHWRSALNFTFWTYVNDRKVVLRTENIFEAKRLTRAVGGHPCMGLNPLTKRRFVVASIVDDLRACASKAESLVS